MPSIALERIWLLGYLDRRFASSWILGMVLLLAVVAVAAGLVLVFAGVDPTASVGAQTVQRAVPMYLVICTFILGFSLHISVLLARTAESDMRALAAGDGIVEQSMESLRPSWRLLLVCITPYIAFNLTSVPLLGSLQGSSPALVFSALLASGAGGMFIYFIILPIGGVMGGTLVALIYRQVRVMTRIARSIDIDLLQLTAYCPIASPLVRLVLITCAFFCPWPIFSAVFDGVNTLFFGQVALLILFLFTLVILAYGYPVIVLRNRIRDRKLAELDQVLRELQGGSESSRSRSELLTEQMFIESRWEWPIESHVQKLVFFGVLPPLSWVLAAMVENAL